MSGHGHDQAGLLPAPLATLTRDQFQSYWRDEHAPLVRRHEATLGIARYVQAHRFDDPRFTAVIAARGGPADSYDGVCEIWYRDMAAFERGGDPAVRRAARALLDDERRFIDLARSPIFFCREDEVIGAR